MSLREEMENGNCQECGWEVSEDAKEGDLCEGCGCELVAHEGEEEELDGETGECEECGGELDRNCNGEMYCPECDGPCLMCSDGV